MRNDCLSAALAVLDRAGIRDVEVAHGSKHPQLRFRINGGALLHVFAIPGSSSDWRSPANVRRDLKKYLREEGISTDEPERPAPPPRQPDRLTLLERRVATLEQALMELQDRVK